jgi:hypothetical protein
VNTPQCDPLIVFFQQESTLSILQFKSNEPLDRCYINIDIQLTSTYPQGVRNGFFSLFLHQLFIAQYPEVTT